MIKHSVIWKLKDSVNGKTKKTQEIKKQLEYLKVIISEMLKLEVGFDFRNIEKSAIIILYSEFELKDALKKYQIHLEHEKVKPFVLCVVSKDEL